MKLLPKLQIEQAAAIQGITVDATGGAGDGDRRNLTRTRFKLGDKRGSLELLGKHLKLFTDKLEQSGPDGGPIATAITVRFVDADGTEVRSLKGSPNQFSERLVGRVRAPHPGSDKVSPVSGGRTSKEPRLQAHCGRRDVI